jgi:hypothetical protein
MTEVIKPGIYRRQITRTATILITVDDAAAFDAALDADDLRNDLIIEDWHWECDIYNGLAVRIERSEHPKIPGIRYMVEDTSLDIEVVHTCRHCGCTNEAACQLEDGPCDWHNDAADCCSNPDCIEKEQSRITQ